MLADDYVLTHRGVFNQRTPTVSQLDQRAPPFVPSNYGQRQNNVRGSCKNQQLNAGVGEVIHHSQLDQSVTTAKRRGM